MYQLLVVILVLLFSLYFRKWFPKLVLLTKSWFHWLKEYKMLELKLWRQKLVLYVFFNDTFKFVLSIATTQFLQFLFLFPMVSFLTHKTFFLMTFWRWKHSSSVHLCRLTSLPGSKCMVGRGFLPLCKGRVYDICHPMVRSNGHSSRIIAFSYV